MVKIKDIAQMSNVSNATVSRILKNDATLKVREETRMRVLDVAESLGYKPKIRKINAMYQIGVVQWISKFEENQDPYYFELRRLIESELNSQGYQVQRFYLEDLEKLFHETHLTGLICIGKFSKSQAQQLKKYHATIVFVDSSPDDALYPSVVFNLEGATTTALEHLVGLGHRKIGFIGGREGLENDSDIFTDPREVTFLEFMKRSDLILDEKFVYISDFAAEWGYHAMKEALSDASHPSAFLCESDTIALGALSALGEVNRKGMVKDVSVISFNDVYAAQFLHPPLTTTKLDVRAMAEATLLLLQREIKGVSKIPLQISLSTQLIKRESTRIKK